MSALKELLVCAGIWRGTNRLQDPHTSSPEDSFSTAIVAPILGGRFVRIDYTWVFYGDPQAGSLLIGHEKKSDVVTAYWIDTWHLNDKVMVCTGVTDDGELLLLGSYAKPSGPDWGWRIAIVPQEGKMFSITMFNVEPDGRESIAVESHYRRVEDRS
jgi:Protein of unknown function (DUF1579)